MNSYFLERLTEVLSNKDFEEKIAIKSMERTLTYNQVKNIVLKISNYFNKKNQKNNLIGLVSGQEPEVYASLLGIIGSGNTYVPLNINHPLERTKSIIESSGMDTIIAVSESDDVEKIISENKNITILYLNEIQSCNSFELQKSTTNERLAYLLFTSGSTGKPKGVPIYLRNLDSYIETLVTGNYGFDENDKILQMFELTFDFSIFSIFLNFSIGATLHIVPSVGLKPLKVFEILEDEKITVAAMVPSVITYLKSFFDEISLPNIKINVFCGEALIDNILKGWAKVCENAKNYNFYGPTEATVFCLEYLWDSKYSSKKAINGIVPIGKPMKGTKAYILDENKVIINDSRKGELCLEGAQVTYKYWNDEKKTQESFINIDIDGNTKTIYRTGDICFRNEDNDFIYLGRKDGQVKVDGYRIELSEIEFHLKEYTNTENLACVAILNDKNNAIIHTFIESKQYKESNIKSYLNRKLPLYMIPKHFYFLDKLPLNLNGKIDRQKLKNFI